MSTYDVRAPTDTPCIDTASSGTRNLSLSTLMTSSGDVYTARRFYTHFLPYQTTDVNNDASATTGVQCANNAGENGERTDL